MNVPWHVLRDLLLLFLPVLVWTIPTRLCGAETERLTRSLDILLSKMSHANQIPRFQPAIGRACREAALYALGIVKVMHSPFISILIVLQVCRFWSIFQKTSLRIRSYSYHEGLCYTVMSWTHGEVREPPKYLYYFKKIYIPRRLNLDYCLPLHFMPDVTAITREVGWEKGIPVWEVFIFFHSLSSWVSHHNTFCTSSLVKHDSLP